MNSTSREHHGHPDHQAPNHKATAFEVFDRHMPSQTLFDFARTAAVTRHVNVVIDLDSNLLGAGYVRRPRLPLAGHPTEYVIGIEENEAVQHLLLSQESRQGQALEPRVRAMEADKLDCLMKPRVAFPLRYCQLDGSMKINLLNLESFCSFNRASRGHTDDESAGGIVATGLEAE
jgi:hypothetical protein